MNQTQVALILAAAKAADDRFKIDDDKVQVWAEILPPDMPYAFAKAQLTAFYRNNPGKSLTIGDLAQPWERHLDEQAKKRRDADVSAELKAIKAGGARIPHNLIDSVKSELGRINQAGVALERLSRSVRCDWCGAPEGRPCTVPRTKADPKPLAEAHDTRRKKAIRVEEARHLGLTTQETR